MPLSMIHTGEPGTIKKVGGKEDTRRFLENLGNRGGCNGCFGNGRKYDCQCQGFPGSHRKGHGK